MPSVMVTMATQQTIRKLNSLKQSFLFCLLLVHQEFRKGSGRTVSIDVAHMVGTECWLSPHSSEGSTGLDVQFGSPHSQQLMLTVGWELHWGYETGSL